MGRSTLIIRPFEPSDSATFAALNRAWLIAHGLFEPPDEAQLGDPRMHILAPGGEIFIAELDGVTVGCCAAIPRGDGALEVAKLAVDPAAQGRGIGRKLVNAAIHFAREGRFTRVILTSNSSLSAALHLYKSIGFREGTLPPDVPYASADIYMELALGILP